MADDEESLDDILSPKGTTTPEIESSEVEPEKSEPARDEHGRFAPKGEAEPEVGAEQPETPEEPEAEQEHNAPVGAVIAERRKAQQANERADKLERDLAEMRGQMSVLMQRGNQPAPQPQQEPPKPIELWDDPNKWGENLLSPVQQQLAEMTFRTSRAEALVEYGKDKVTAAETAIKEAVARGELDGQRLAAQLSKSRDPVGDVVKWHQNSPAVQQATLRETLRAELMAELGIDPNKQPVPKPSTQTPVVKMPPSLTKIPAGHAAPERDESLDEVLSQSRRARA